MIGIRAYLEVGAAMVLAGVLVGWWVDHNYKEQAIGATAVEHADTKATAKVEAQADAQTEANAVNAALAALGATSAQTAVDDYMATHPVDPGSVPVIATADRGSGGVRQARAAHSGAQSAGPGSAPVSPVLGGQQDRALAEILSAASRLAVIDTERQHR